jgi:trans-aconitate methyltransferase
MPDRAGDQHWDAGGYARHADFVPRLGVAVVELLDIQPGQRILDLGCGNGTLTAQIVEAGATVVGVDSSPEMIAAAVARGLDARVMDVTKLTFDDEFDAVFSNAALHWVKNDPDAPITGAYRALKAQGRFAGELGGLGNVAAISTALVATLNCRGIENARNVIPWYFPTPDEYRARLERAGFWVDYLELIPRPTPLPTGMRGWLETFANPFCAAIPVKEREAYLDEVTQLLEPILRDSHGNWTADYCRLRFSASKA